MCPEFFSLHEHYNIFYWITQKYLDFSKFLASVRKFLALFWNFFFIVYEDNIIYSSNDTKISGLLNISDVCLEISSMCPEIWIEHKDFAIFLLWHKNVQIAFLRMSRNLWLAFGNFQIGTHFWSVYRNFQHVSGNFDCTKILYLFSIIWHNKFPAYGTQLFQPLGEWWRCYNGKWFLSHHFGFGSSEKPKFGLNTHMT